MLLEQWLTDDEIRHRFLEEARLLRKVRSDSLVTVHDIGELEDGRPYFVMEFADAGTLADRLRSRSVAGLDLASGEALVRVLADGLGALHGQGVVHRDINPKNLMVRHATKAGDDRAHRATSVRSGLLGADEHVLIGDLGLAKDTAREGSAEVSIIGGTANYMAPEQIDIAGTVGPETDVFAATGVLWECVVGTPPPNPTALVAASAGLDEKWRAFFVRGLAEARSDRFRNMEAWRDAALECLAGGTVAAPVSGLRRRDESPYLGLSSFQPEDADRFFGRTQLVDDLLARLRVKRMLVVGGPSGSGKSSLVRAGLIPAAAAGALGGSERWPIGLMTPGADPVGELAYQLSKLVNVATQQSAQHLSGPELAAEANRGRLLAETITSRSSGAILVIDQFEELFTQGPDRAGQQAFVEALAALVDPVDSKMRIVLAVRADFYGACASFPWLADKITENQVLVGPMTRAELREAVEEPARRASLVIEAGVVDAVLEEGGAEPGTLPLVSHALAETWRRRSGSMMTLDGYRQAGGVSGAIAQTANALFDDRFDSAQRTAVRRLMLRLVNPGEGTADTKRALRTADLDPSDEIMNGVVELMTEARLLTVSQDTVEIAHEALIRTWPRLRQWIDESRDDLRMRQHIARAAVEWIEQDHDEDLLYRGTPLASALEWAETKPDVLEPSDQVFLDASREARDKALAEQDRAAARSRKVRTGAIAVLSVLTIVAAIAGLAAFNASRQSNDRFAQSLAAQAFNLAEDNPRLALALAVEAIVRGQSDSFEARSALVEASRVLADAPLAPAASNVGVGDALSVAVAPDGSLVAAGYRDGTIRLWEPMLGGPITEPLDGHGGAVNDIAFTSDGGSLISASNDGTIRRWDVTRPTEPGPPATLANHAGIIWRIALSPDDRTVASASEDGKIQEWDAVNGSPVGEPLIEITRDFLSVVYSPDGAAILAGNGRGEIHGWDRSSRLPLFEMFNAHTSDVWHIRFDSAGSNFATSSSDGTVRVWNRNGEPVAQAYAGQSENGAAIQFSGDRLLLGTEDGRIGVWDPETRALELTPPGHGGEIVDMDLTRGSEELITLSTDQSIRAWTPPTAARNVTLEAQAGGVASVAAAPSGTVITGGNDGVIVLYPPASVTGTPLPEPRHSGPVTALAFNAAGDRFVSGGADGAWWLNDVSIGQVVTEQQGAHTGPIAAIAIEGEIVATGGEDGFVRTWNSSGELQRELGDSHDGGVTALATHDGRLASADRRGTVRIYDLGSGELTSRPFAADDNTIWDLAFSLDGKLLATASADEVVTIWDVATLDPVGSLTPHDSEVTAVVFVDEVTVASLDRKGNVRMWDVLLNRQLGSAIKGHGDDAWSLAAGFGDSTFVSASIDGTVHVWNLLSLEAACKKSQGTFDAEQQRRFLSGANADGCVQGAS